ncbi:hypothetical protein PV797_21545 [Clostridiaceae bacterium M8S5]|nr:hypothetical protein PV797_21545 [Clostridiaceae bacterium M8S5]
MSLLSMVRKDSKTISIVGMSKNAGKTVTLNKLIQDSLKETITLGVTSTGRDGEEKDVLTNTHKPLVFVPKGTIITTTDRLFDNGDAKLEIIYTTNFTTPMGYVVLARIIEEGNVQIAGPQTNNDIRVVSDIMLKFGVDLVLIDGSIDRISSASSSISDGTVISCGAVLDRDINKVITETAHKIRLMQMGEVEQKIKELIKQDDDVIIINKQLKVDNLKLKTALSSGKVIASKVKEDTTHVILPGSLTSAMAKDMINSTKHRGFTLVVKDGTRVFINHKQWTQVISRNLNVKVLNKINVRAVTLNPYSPKGYYFNPKEFLTRMRASIKDIPVVDVILEEAIQQNYGGDIN